MTAKSDRELTIEELRPEIKRTHYCADLSEKNIDEQIVLNGWVHKVRDLGGLVFVTLRDRSGTIQMAVDANDSPDLAAKCQQLRAEYVISARGVVQPRPEQMRREDQATGAIEVRMVSLHLLAEADVPPFVIQDNVKAKDELRLKYRYLDLRRPIMAKRLKVRHIAAQEARRSLSDDGFIEVETPFMIRSTPEGARDYIVPSRIRRGSCYALPQSPQLLKQLLMIGGVDRYYQIVRCFRDEDLRANRQPEFTQINIEMSFADEADIFDVAEKLTCSVYGKALGVEMPRPFPILTYDEAMSRFGSDKPDTRYELKLCNLTEMFKQSEFVPFREAVEKNGLVVGICGPGGASYSRKVVDSLSQIVRPLGVFGLISVRATDDGVTSSAKKFIHGAFAQKLLDRLSAGKGDVVLLASGPVSKVLTAMGRVRQELATKENLIPEGAYKPLWVTEFPLFDSDEETGQIIPMHHPFTGIHSGDEQLLDTDPLKVRGRLYDLVINDQEIAGGGVRISNPELQMRVFEAIGIDKEEAARRFGFFLDALRFGTPPHCGIAYGFDRMVMQLCGVDSIADVIPFPKTTAASCLMTGAPAPMDEAALDELGLKLKE
ncbi:aspartate--tRNA ligase [bacterium]|nr:aspartate--tRNA ligase [bacterium]